jgi:hypothetical protein
MKKLWKAILKKIGEDMEKDKDFQKMLKIARK